jgi:uracil-DNA glycosylase family 4
MLIVGESPAPNGWRTSGRAFYSPDGRLLPTGRNLNAVLERFGLDVGACSFTELVKCFVGKDRHLLDACGARCWPIFVEQVSATRCSAIVLLGKTTLRVFNRMCCASVDIEMGVPTSVVVAGARRSVLALHHPSPVNPFGHRRNLDIVETCQATIAAWLDGD